MIYESFMTEEVAHNGMIPIPNTDKEGCYGGHCMYAIAYNDTAKDHIDILNSWGRDWGDKGRCHIPIDYFMQEASDLWAIHLTE